MERSRHGEKTKLETEVAHDGASDEDSGLATCQMGTQERSCCVSFRLCLYLLMQTFHIRVSRNDASRNHRRFILGGSKMIQERCAPFLDQFVGELSRIHFIRLMSMNFTNKCWRLFPLVPMSLVVKGLSCRD